MSASSRTALSRRTFLLGLAAAPLAVSAGCALGGSSTPAPGAVAAPNGLRSLPIPPLATATTDTAGVRRFTLTARPGSTEILPGKRTPTWGYDGSILGPTIRARRGETVAFTIENALPEATTVHWHGMHVPARFDGGPHQTIAPGARWNPTWTVNQPAASLWYHPHPHGATEKHVYRGLAGMFLIDDEDSDAPDLPKDYGVDDIPLIVQDKRFHPDGTLDESDPTDVGLLGDTLVTNGIAGAYLPVRTSLVRLRILNGSAGRMYNFGFADGRGFQMIASDGGLLRAPVALERIALSPGERAEIVVAVDGGVPVMLRAFPFEDRAGLDRSHAAQFGVEDTFDVLELRPAANLGRSAALPAVLASIPRPDLSAVAAERHFELKWFMINGERMDMNRIDFSSAVDTTEVWTVRNTDNWPHSFHVHDTQFQILDIDGTPPPPDLAGWKDTIYTTPGRTFRLALRFADYTDPTLPYMYHCHMLFHEDQGMMGQFLVLAPGQQPAPMTMDMPMGEHGDGQSRRHA
ncbi:multicopper oxidase domain-containing protein [Rhodococcus sp. D2-41]|uniref:multicopper oxidase family protein n=1 Tax=Speluncibacter jeojiensis TaxID=2710754 RepID=UPI0024108E2A|nr:multicopper oxidase domain-containing protein [Rhodococcus sp. D2-41]MDG3008701.1 multicopper oxidase domain-containing protein [Rhodococcus sp. D2-41]